ncbi:MAG: hypothetical protein K2L87_07610, partial [Clostridiales bacterium]|nr:hypothetical protein [Clostridiales bacterium]
MKVITVFKTHFDIGFTKLTSEIVSEYGGSMLERAVSVCEETQNKGKALEYKWTMAAWPLWKALQTAEPSLKARAEKLIARGQLLWHALPFTTHTEFCSKEELIRGLRFSKELSEKYDRPLPISAKMTDVPGHTRYLVSLLAKAGVKFLHLGCNPASTPPSVPTLFFWENTDGERILVFYNKTYGSSPLPPAGWKYPVWLNMCLTNDNIGPQSADVIDETVKACAGAEAVIGSMDDFYRELSACDLSDVPVLKGEMSDSWIHGAGTYPQEVKLLADARKKLLAAERGYALSPYNEETQKLLEEAYEQSLLFGEHTWGLDVKTTLGDNRAYEKKAFEKERGEDRYLRLEASWEEQKARARRAHEIAEILAGKYPVKQSEEKGDACYADFDGEKIVLSQNDKTLAEIYPPVYHVAGKDEVTNFERAYLRRLYFWAIADFGRLSYPEIESEWFKPVSCKWKDEVLELTYSKRAVEVFGMAEKVFLRVNTKEGVQVSLSMTKSATPYLESCSLPVKFFDEGIVLHKTGGGVRQAEILPNANKVAHCVNKVTAGGVEVVPESSFLVSRGGDILCRFEPNFVPTDNIVYFNLFNNMWGTNFPQYLEG